ncbi:flagellar basal body L-ring protein [Rhodobacteraceae bacterium WD3A24]|nr:flagellar basal body L-ring protein [Rhodobacteraceae bacterium WD3A24]
MRMIVITACLGLLVAGCGRLSEVGRAPAFSPTDDMASTHAMYSVPVPERRAEDTPTRNASIWSTGQRSLLGDRRAQRRGDILTVLIEIDDSAEISNSSERARSSSENMGVSDFFGIPQRLESRLPDGAETGSAVGTSSASSYRGDGSVSRNERLELRLAATVTERLPNGVLHIEGSQEVRVNYELRELTLSGYVRPEDISRRNEITYDRIAGARISYGGRGQIDDVQQPRIGQQITDMILPF